MAAKKKIKKIEVSLEKLVEAGAHFGHQIRRWNPKMEIFMHSQKEGVFVFDLIKTRARLEEALGELQKAAKEGKKILLVGTKKQIKNKLKDIAEECGQPYVEERWLGGTLTNFDQVRKTIAKLADLEALKASSEFNTYTKKERLMMTRKIAKTRKAFGGIRTMKSKPDMMVVIGTHREKGAVMEAQKEKIPVVGIVDSNADPDLIDWPVPMNDDATGALEYVLDLIKSAICQK